MAIKPTEPYRNPTVDPDLSMASEPFADDAVRENAQLRAPRDDDARIESELQASPKAANDHTSMGRIVLYALAILVAIGAIFYGLNASTTNTASNPSAPNTAQNSTPPSGAAGSPPPQTGQTAPAPNPYPN